MNKVRINSWNIVKSCNLSINNNLPLLNSNIRLRQLNDISNRLFSLHAVVASSFGFSKEKAINWLIQESLFDSITDNERDFLSNSQNNIDPTIFRHQVESLWALAWIISIVKVFSFHTSCSNSFHNLLPDLKASESINTYKNIIILQDLPDVIKNLDLSYCLHWAIVDASLNNRLLNIKPLPGLIERRHAFEWACCSLEWDNISLDT